MTETAFREIERKSQIKHAKIEAEWKAQREATKFDRPYYINIYWEDGIYSTYYETEYEALEAATGDVNNATGGMTVDWYRKTLYVVDHKIVKKFIFDEQDIQGDDYDYNEDHRLGSFELCGVR